MWTRVLLSYFYLFIYSEHGWEPAFMICVGCTIASGNTQKKKKNQIKKIKSETNRRGGSSKIKEMHYTINLDCNNLTYLRTYLFKQKCYYYFCRQRRAKHKVIFYVVSEPQKRSQVKLKFSVDILQAVWGYRASFFASFYWYQLDELCQKYPKKI